MAVWEYIRHLDDHVAEMIKHYGAWTYGILFGILFAETGLVVTPFLPGDTLLFAAGLFSRPETANHQEGLNIWITLGVLTLAPLCGALAERSVRYVLIGVSAANLYGPDGQAIFTTEDFDLFLPLDAPNLLRAWEACEQTGLQLWIRDEPLDRPRDMWLAEQVVAHHTLTRVTGPDELRVDLTLLMKGFEFEEVWSARRSFLIEGIELPVARLLHIIQSKHAAGRDKDKLFLATHRDALEQLLKKPDTD
jgi:hypothetical protein